MLVLHALYDLLQLVDVALQVKYQLVFVLLYDLDLLYVIPGDLCRPPFIMFPILIHLIKLLLK